MRQVCPNCSARYSNGVLVVPESVPVADEQEQLNPLVTRSTDAWSTDAPVGAFANRDTTRQSETRKLDEDQSDYKSFNSPVGTALSTVVTGRNVQGDTLVNPHDRQVSLPRPAAVVAPVSQHHRQFNRLFDKVTMRYYLRCGDCGHGMLDEDQTLAPAEQAEADRLRLLHGETVFGSAVIGAPFNNAQISDRNQLASIAQLPVAGEPHPALLPSTVAAGVDPITGDPQLVSTEQVVTKFGHPADPGDVAVGSRDIQFGHPAGVGSPGLVGPQSVTEGATGTGNSAPLLANEQSLKSAIPTKPRSTTTPPPFGGSK